MTPTTLSDEDFKFVQSLVKSKAAIILEDSKAYLVDARLSALIKKLQLPTVAELIHKVRINPNDKLSFDIIDAMTTNETSFFRDIHPFDILKNKVLPDMIAKRATTKRLYIWCAAASSGQEPYTLAMILKEHCGAVLQNWDVKIIATDLSNEILAKARSGLYSQLEVGRGLPIQLLVKYFKKSGLNWQVNDEIRNMIEFRNMNLIETWPAMPRFDIIFIRNVLIYFEADIKTKILNNAAKLLQNDGYLFLGATETLLNLALPFKRVQIDNSFCYKF
jgi:chemotaxis protein methyltransferase CheR